MTMLETEKKILELLKKKSLRFTELRDTIGVTGPTVHNAILKLMVRGYIIRTVHSHKNISYSLTEKGKNPD